MSYCLIYQVIDTRSIVRSRGALTRGRHVSCRRATGPQLDHNGHQADLSPDAT